MSGLMDAFNGVQLGGVPFCIRGFSIIYLGLVMHKLPTYIPA
jgi:hypothetical protein